MCHSLVTKGLCNIRYVSAAEISFCKQNLIALFAQQNWTSHKSPNAHFVLEKDKRKLKNNDDFDMRFGTDGTSSPTNLRKNSLLESVNAESLNSKFTLLFDHSSNHVFILVTLF